MGPAAHASLIILIIMIRRDQRGNCLAFIMAG
jgi:hypothetical protein